MQLLLNNTPSLIYINFPYKEFLLYCYLINNILVRRSFTIHSALLIDNLSLPFIQPPSLRFLFRPSSPSPSLQLHRVPGRVTHA